MIQVQSIQGIMAHNQNEAPSITDEDSDDLTLEKTSEPQTGLLEEEDCTEFCDGFESLVLEEEEGEYDFDGDNHFSSFDFVKYHNGSPSDDEVAQERRGEDDGSVEIFFSLDPESGRVFVDRERVYEIQQRIGEEKAAVAAKPLSPKRKVPEPDFPGSIFGL